MRKFIFIHPTEGLKELKLEHPVTLDEVHDAAIQGTLTLQFASGTSVSITVSKEKAEELLAASNSYILEDEE